MGSLSKRTIIFDGQVFQSTAWDRGMGKYSYNLLSSLSKSKEFTYKNVKIVFSKNKELPKEAQKALSTLGKKFELEYLDLQLPKVLPGENIKPIEDHNILTLNNYIQSSNYVDVDFVILSLMIDQYAAVFPSVARKVLLFYDLILYNTLIGTEKCGPTTTTYTDLKLYSKLT
jgi:hypothetical protein